MKLTGREREESRGKGWEQRAKGPTRKSSQKIEEENGSRKREREWHRDEVRESLRGGRGGGGWREPYRERTQTGGHKMKSPRAGVRGVEGVKRG